MPGAMKKKPTGGLKKLPTAVRNKMGYMKAGGMVKKKMMGGGMAKKPAMMMAGGMAKKSMGYKKGGMAKAGASNPPNRKAKK